jgi:sulfur carrier protein
MGRKDCVMKVVLPDKSCRELHIEEGVIEDILKSLNINPVEVIVARNGKVVSELDRIADKDEMRIIRVVHGG